MIIYLKNKETLVVDDFYLKCCVGKNGLNSEKREGAYHCANCGVHHGHVFANGLSKKRFCNNGLCLIFKPDNNQFEYPYFLSLTSPVLACASIPSYLEILAAAAPTNSVDSFVILWKLKVFTNFPTNNPPVYLPAPLVGKIWFVPEHLSP